MSALIRPFCGMACASLAGMAQFKDILLAGIAFGMPAYFVFRSRRSGILLGAGGLWLLVFLCGEVGYAWAGSPPEENRGAIIEEWLMGGWASGLVYCSLVWLLKQGFLMFRRGLAVYHQQMESGLSADGCFWQVWRELNQTPEPKV